MATEIKYLTKEDAMVAVTQYALELKYCTPELQNNKEVVMAAIKQIGTSFQHASDELKSNKDFILKALNEGVEPLWLIAHTKISIQSDIEVMTLAVEKSTNGGLFCYAQEEVAINKELAAKALVKWGKLKGKHTINFWNEIHPTLQIFFPRNSWYEKAQSYLNQLNQERQAELVAGGCTAEDEVVW